MRKLYIDTETCGLHSFMVLLQYAWDDGPIHLYNVWKEPVWKTLELIESFLDGCIVGFNLTFDWYHLNKLYTIFSLLPPDWIPEEHIDEIAEIEPQGRDAKCIKPASAMDLMLHGRKGPLQSLMGRKSIRIRRVPAVLANELAVELERRVELDGIYFAKRKQVDAPRWRVLDCRNRDDEIVADFKDVELSFAAAGGLKFIAEHLLGHKPKYHYTDVEPDPEWYPIEYGYAPFAAAVSSKERNWDAVTKKGKEGKAWPGVIQKFIDHWAENEPAREYARNDIVFTRDLDKYFEYPEPGDDDSILACMVPVVRWRGFQLDLEGIKQQRAKAQDIYDAAPITVTAPVQVKKYLLEVMDETEALSLDTTDKKKLISLQGWDIEDGDECSKCGGDGCARCENGKTVPKEHPVSKVGTHPVAHRAYEMLSCKMAGKEIELYDKLLMAGRFHASFVVIGTLSTRMAGGDGLNPQGIKATDEVRRLFPLAWEGFNLSGGDFDGFEITILEAECNDPKMREDLLRGLKIHAIFAQAMYPEETYESIMASKGTEDDLYGDGKTGVFGTVYGGDENTLVRNVGISLEAAQNAFASLNNRYKGFGRSRQEVFDSFSAMTQPAGLGTAVVWKDPQEYVESFLGFKRYFTLEWKVMKALFQLAQAPPPGLKNKNVHVMRSTGRVQTAGGATASALYGAAFGIQGKIQRAANNHKIQSPGGQITKNVQRRVWDLQPVGVHELVVAPLNVHDELMIVNHPDYTDAVSDAVEEGVTSYRDAVPLIGMTWYKQMLNWAEKKGGEAPVHMTHGLTLDEPQLLETQ